jgi:hypothetical protein
MDDPHAGRVYPRGPVSSPHITHPVAVAAPAQGERVGHHGVGVVAQGGCGERLALGHAVEE